MYASYVPVDTIPANMCPADRAWTMLYGWIRLVLGTFGLVAAATCRRGRIRRYGESNPNQFRRVFAIYPEYSFAWFPTLHAGWEASEGARGNWGGRKFALARSTAPRAVVIDAFAPAGSRCCHCARPSAIAGLSLSTGLLPNRTEQYDEQSIYAIMSTAIR